VLLLDAGDTLFGQMLALQSEGRVIIEAMSAMGYDAMAVGQMDLAKGVDVLLARAKEARFPILSCNLVNAQEQKPIFQPYALLERGGVRFALLGVTEPAALEAPGVRDVAQVLDPVATVKKYLAELKGQSDVLIVLSHLGVEGDRALAQALPEIDLIVGGKSRRVMSAPDIVGSTVITQMGYDGEWLGRLDVTLDAQGQVRDPQSTVIELGPDVADDAELKALADSHKERFAQPTTEPAK
jgi:2',3'-cyclic-nucleotide 2'-phosphodiesterase (5'-nucleotidase family)